MSCYRHPMRTKLQVICSLSAIRYKCFCKLGCSLYIASNVHLTYTTLYHTQVHLKMYIKIANTLYIIS